MAKIKKGQLVEITLYAMPLEDMEFLFFIDDLDEKYPYWKFQNHSYRIISKVKEDK